MVLYSSLNNSSFLILNSHSAFGISALMIKVDFILDLQEPDLIAGEAFT